MFSNNFNSEILEKLNEESNIRIRDPSLLNNTVTIQQNYDNNLQITLSDNFINSQAKSVIPIIEKAKESTCETNKNIYNLSIAPIIHNVFTDFTQETLSKLNDVLLINDQKTKSFIFPSQEKLFEQLEDNHFVEQLNKGDLFFIESEEEPDYWWDGETIQKIEIEWPYKFVVSDQIPTIDDESIITFIV